MQKPKPEVKALKAEGEGKGSRKRQQHKGKRHFFNWERGQSPRNWSKLKGWVGNPPTVIMLCYALRQNEKGRRKTSKGKYRRQSMKAEDKDRR